MMRMALCGVLAFAMLIGPAVVGGCGTGAEGGDVGAGDYGAEDAGAEGLPPGAGCAVDPDAGEPISTSCLDNPALPTCFQCVDLTDDGRVDGVCVFTCRMGEADCPSGETCTTAGSTYRTSYQPCRDLTDGHELGYCR